MKKIILLFILVLVISCSKNRKVLNEEDLRESIEYVSGMWSYYEKGWDVTHYLKVSLPNEKKEKVFYYYAKGSNSDEYLTKYKGVINPSSFKNTRMNGNSVIEIKPIRFINGTEYLGNTFYFHNSSSYRPRYQLRTTTLDMFGNGFSKYIIKKDDVNYFEFENALNW
jgi:hypothetical protein